MAELAERAGQAPPEIEERGGEVVVRFLPTGFVPPSRVSHNLSPLQQQLLDLLSHQVTVRLKDVQGALPEHPVRTIQDNLKILKELRLVRLVGKGAGARWTVQDLGRTD